MRKIHILVVFLALALAACAQTPEAIPSPTGSPAQPTPAETPVATAPAPQGFLTAAPAATSTAPPAVATSVPLEVEPAAQPTAALPTPTSAAPSLWPHLLREIDLGIPTGNSYNPRALALHPGLGRLYARTVIHGPEYRDIGQVAVLDLSNGQVLAVVETGPDSFSEGALAVDTVRNRVYAHNPGDLTVTVLEARTLKEVATLEAVDRFALDVEGGRLYVAGTGGLRVLDAAKYDTLSQVLFTYAPQFVAMAVDAVENRVYVAYQDASGSVLAQYDASTLKALATTALPGRPDALLPDPARSRLYLTLSDGSRNLLWVVDGDGQRLEERPLGEWTQRTCLALDPEGDRLFLGRDAYGNYGITILDLNTGREAGNIPLTQPPNVLAWDQGQNRLLVSHTYFHRIGVVDCQKGLEIAVWPTALNLTDLAVDPARGHLYITDSAGQLHVLDSDTDKELALLPGEGRIAVDSPHGRLYTGGEGADRVRIYDAEALQQTGEIRFAARPVADAYHGGLYLVQAGVYIASPEDMAITGVLSDTLPQYPGFSPNPAAIDAVVDPGSGRLFAIINNGVPGSNNGNYLYVYEPETYQKVLTDTERSPIYLDVDPVTGRAYVSRIHLGGRSTSLWTPGQGYTARLEALFGALRADPTLGRVYSTIYSTTDGQMLILDAANLDILDSVPIPAGFTLWALDPQRHLLYLATVEGQVQIWSATGGKPPPAEAPEPADLSAEAIYKLFATPQEKVLFALDKGQVHLYRSDNGGASWLRLRGGLPEEQILDLAISPTFAQDQTLFAALATADQGYGVWKSADGGRSWHIASRGLTDLAVVNLTFSPIFAQDQTLFALARKGGLYRSADAGERWTSLTGRYRPPTSTYPEPPGRLYFSPTYAQDRTIFLSHYGLQRSTDGGETWTTLFPQAVEPLAFSPDFAADHTLFGWTSYGGLLRSTNGGETWVPVSAGLSLPGDGSVTLFVSPDFSTSQTLYFLWTARYGEAPPQLFRSTDAATTWERLVGQPPQAATPIKLSADGSAFIAHDQAGGEVRWPLADLTWQAGAPPPVADIAFSDLIPSPDSKALYALSAGAGILRSNDAGLTWTDTGFPIRSLYGFLQPVFVPPDSLLVSTGLGLYRSTAGGPWTPVGGGLPQGADTKGLAIGTDGSLRVLVNNREVYLSTDGGRTWKQPFPRLPNIVAPEDLRFSPAFATDRTAFYAPSWQKPLRTIGGGPWQAFGPPGEWTLSVLEVSPAFDRDRLLLMRLGDNSLWRSTDGGGMWVDISGPWATAGGMWGEDMPLAVHRATDYTLHAVTFSPAYAQDGLLLTRAGNVLYRSTDQGSTWTRVLSLEFPKAQAVFTPDYARDGAIYLLSGNRLYYSADRGRTWQALPAAPWNEDNLFVLEMSPTFAQDHTLLAWTGTGPVYLSSDAGRSWAEASGGLPPASITEMLFSSHYASDGLIYLVPYTGGLYKRVGNSPWLPITAGGPSPTPTRPPQATRPPRPTASPTPAACPVEPLRFRAVWQQARDRLGCPQQADIQIPLAEQPFERGRMFWDSHTQQIYVLLEAGTWQAFGDTFVEGQDPAYDPALPPPPQQPQRGFGKVWREQLGGPQATIGWALEKERLVNGWRQRFERGVLIWTDTALPGATEQGTAYLLYDDGTWQAIATPQG